MLPLSYLPLFFRTPVPVSTNSAKYSPMVLKDTKILNMPFWPFWPFIVQNGRHSAIISHFYRPPAPAPAPAAAADPGPRASLFELSYLKDHGILLLAAKGLVLIADAGTKCVSADCRQHDKGKWNSRHCHAKETLLSLIAYYNSWPFIFYPICVFKS